MTDRELLELAAKAAELKLIWNAMANALRNPITRYVNAHEYDEWNPLTDDGDAMRLAVKLKIDIRPSMSGNSRVRYAWHDGRTYAAVDLDPYAATRRAIVRAAAKIGKAMP